MQPRLQHMASVIERRLLISAFQMSSLIEFWRGAGVVTEQIANLSTRKCRQGSNPCLSA